MMKTDTCVPDSCANCDNANTECGNFYGSLKCVYGEQIVELCLSDQMNQKE